MIEMEGVAYRYRGGDEIAFPDWRVETGEQWHIRGPSGCGKTTLLHLIAGLLTPQRGKVAVLGTDWGTLSGGKRDRMRGRHIGIVFQRHHLLPALTVKENLLLARSLAGLPRDSARVHQVLERLDLQHRAGARPETLSGGEAQRASLARAVINGPQLLLADEPTTALDDTRCGQVVALLRELAREHGATLLVASHDRRLEPHLERALTLTETRSEAAA